jgi:hypothetical protein
MRHLGRKPAGVQEKALVPCESKARDYRIPSGLSLAPAAQGSSKSEIGR